MKIIYGVKWWYYLISVENKVGVFTDSTRKKFLDKCLICWEYPDDKKGKVRLYTAFNTYLDFAKFYLKVLSHQRSFYEIILGEHIQKPHFDLDIGNVDSKKHGIDASTVLSDLLSAIVKNIPDCKPETDVCVYSSHGSLQHDKQSYHVVINHFYHENNENAKEFYNIIVGQLPKIYTDNCWIDGSVYSKTQHFRMYGCHKFGSNRSKILESDFFLNNFQVKHIADEVADTADMKFLINLQESLVCARTSTCKKLQTYVNTEKKQYFQEDCNIDSEMVNMALRLLSENLNIDVKSKNFPFSIDKTSGSFIVLKRLKASYCKLCLRTHHHQNPYLLVTKNDNVYYHCRRAPSDKKLHLGNLTFKNSELSDLDSSNSYSDINSNTNSDANDWVKLKIQNLKKSPSPSSPSSISSPITIDIISPVTTNTIETKFNNLKSIADKEKNYINKSNQKQIFNQILNKRLEKIQKKI